jgi:hypothetical protein
VLRSVHACGLTRLRQERVRFGKDKVRGRLFSASCLQLGNLEGPKGDRFAVRTLLTLISSVSCKPCKPCCKLLSMVAPAWHIWPHIQLLQNDRIAAPAAKAAAAQSVFVYLCWQMQRLQDL